MRYMISPPSLYFATPLAFNAPDGEVPLWDHLHIILHGGQRMAKVHSGEEIFRKLQPLDRVHVCTNVTHKRQIDRRICDSKDPNVTK